MKYIVLVSHGMFAPGLHDALGMLAGENRSGILSTSLKNGMGADEFAEHFKELISVVKEEDEILLFADLLGGSPLTVSANVLASSMGVNLVGATIIASMFAIINYKIKMLQIAKPVAGAAGTFDDEEEDI